MGAVATSGGEAADVTGRHYWRTAAALTAAAFFLRWLGAGRRVLDQDELLQLYGAFRPDSLGEAFALLRALPLHAVLDPLLTYALAQVSRDLSWLRLQPALLGAACVPALLWLARRFADAEALLAGGLLAVSVHHAEFSGFVDFYPFMALWALVTTALLLRAAARPGRKGFAAYGAALCGFLYTHPWAVLVAAFHGAWLLRHRREKLPPFLLACAGAAAAFLPWAWYAAGGALAEPRLRYDFPQAGVARALWSTLSCWAGAPERGFYDPAPFAAWTRLAAPLYAALAILGLGGPRSSRRWSPEWALAAALAFGGAPAVLLADRLAGYDYAPRQALFALPFFLLFVARGLLALWRSSTASPLGRTAAALAALAAAAAAWGQGREMTRQLFRIGDDTRAIAARLGRAEPGKTLLFDEPNHAARLLFYLDPAALSRLEPPRRFENVYSLGLPEGLETGGRSVEAVWRPHETASDEERRWSELARRVSAGLITMETSDFGFVRPVAMAKTLEFRQRHAAAFARGRAR